MGCFRVIRRQALRFWPTFPQAGCSLIADHIGLCLDILNDSTDNGVAVQQFNSSLYTAEARSHTAGGAYDEMY